MARDYYQVLGVSRSAPDKDIRQAYRKLARKYHPDLNPNDKAAEARFKEIGEAYDVLSDPEKRQKYDRYGHAWDKAGAAAAGAGRGRASTAGFDFGRTRFSGGRANVGSDHLNDLFERFFGGTGVEDSLPRTGQDVEHPVEVSLEEAFTGTPRVLEFGGGNGNARRLEVRIPAGVRTGSRVRVAGEGGPGIGGAKRGDAFLVVTVRPHPNFERKGDDLHTEVSVELTRAVLGGEVEVPTLRGKLALKIPPETQNGKVFRLGGQGMPKLEDANTRGDLYAKVRVVLPTNLTDRERELFAELAKIRS
ncbi:MAG: J domain-containing protein [Chloroflexi bacterium]|nr:J domain-containing protein [Chloroflexota bacterium]